MVIRYSYINFTVKMILKICTLLNRQRHRDFGTF